MIELTILMKVVIGVIAVTILVKVRSYETVTHQDLPDRMPPVRKPLFIRYPFRRSCKAKTNRPMSDITHGPIRV